MNNEFAGALLPVWILGAPLLLALFEWMRTPKPARVGAHVSPRTPTT